jgi:hypothetical protein
MNNDKPKRPYVRTFPATKRHMSNFISQAEAKRRIDIAFERIVGPCISPSFRRR